MRNLISYAGVSLALLSFMASKLILVGAPAPVELLSVKNSALPPIVSGSGSSLAPFFTADGTKLIFVSQAANLVTNDHNGSLNDIFIRDLTNGVTTLVSVNFGDQVSANGASDIPVASSNGQYIAFVSAGTDFGAADANGAYDLVWRDLAANVTKLLRVGISGTGGRASIDPPIQASINPSISGDGRWVAFESYATNLVEHDTNRTADVFLWDTQTDTTTLVSATTNRSGSARGDSQNAIISANGKKVAYVSRTALGINNNIAHNTNNHSSELYVFDIDTLENKMVKVSTTNLTGEGRYRAITYNHTISVDGRYLAFQANHSFTNQLKAGIYWVDLETDNIISFEQKWNERMAQLDPPVAASISTTNALGLMDFTGPAMSADGQVLAFEATYRQAGLTFRDVWVWWPGINEIRRLTNSVSESVANKNLSPSISADGRYVVAHSTETGLFVADLSDLSTKEGLGNDELPGAVLSPDGSLLAFQARTDGLVTNEHNQAYDVFVRDLADDSLHLVSEHAEGLPSLSGFGSSGFTPRGISDDGRYVVFTSTSSTLVTNDLNGNLMDVFVRDLVTGTTELVSMSNYGMHSANGNSFNPTISADGQFVAFESYATDAAPTTGAAGRNVFVRSLLMRATDLASRPLTNGIKGDSFGGVISADGRHVVFQSYIRAMAEGYETNENNLGMDRDTYLYSVETRSLRMVSPNVDGANISANIHSSPATISGDGNIIAFQENLTTSIGITYIYNVASNAFVATLTNGPAYLGLAINRDGTHVYRPAYIPENVRIYDLATQSRFLIPAEERTGRYSRRRMASSFDGRFVAYSAGYDNQFVDDNSDSDVYVYDAVTSTRTLVSLNKYGTNTGNGPSDYVSMSGDGRFVAFQSTASDLVEGDDNGTSDIFVRDLLLNTTTRVSSGPGPHRQPLISANGRVVVFSSGANNPAFGDFNNSADTYAAHFTVDDGTADSDTDGMSDSWELSIFSDLSRDGTGDADQDGLSDLNEFRAGTHPLDDQSTFAGQILTTRGDFVAISWQAVFGKKYRVDYRDDLTEGEWLPLEKEYFTSNGIARIGDAPPAGTERRYYRIVIIDTP